MHIAEQVKHLMALRAEIRAQLAKQENCPTGEMTGIEFEFLTAQYVECAVIQAGPIDTSHE